MSVDLHALGIEQGDHLAHAERAVIDQQLGEHVSLLTPPDGHCVACFHPQILAMGCDKRDGRNRARGRGAWTELLPGLRDGRNRARGRGRGPPVEEVDVVIVDGELPPVAAPNLHVVEAETGTEVDGGGGGRPVPGWLSALVEQGLEAVVVFDDQLRVVYANDEALRILGYRWSELAGLDALSLVHPDDLGRSVANVSGVAAGARPDPGLIRVRVGDGSWRPVEVNPRQVSLPEPPDGPGAVMAVSLRDHLLEDTHWRFLADQAAGRDFEAALTDFARGLSGVIDGPMGVAFEVDGRRRTVGPLPAALTWPGPGPEPAGRARGDDPWGRALATGEPCCTVVEELPPAQREVARALGVGVVVVVPVTDPAHDVPALLVQCPYEPAMGDIHLAALAARPRQAVGIGLERRHALALLQRLAHHDPLTGLANRARFFDHLSERHLSEASSGVCYLDLDRFKGVNDTHGHQVGDAVLLRVAAALLEAADGADVVARLGGDEFGVVCATGDVDVVAALASRVVDALDSGVKVDGVHHDIGVSVGVAVGVDPPDVLVAAADAALYEAKRDGRGTWRVAGPEPTSRRVGAEPAPGPAHPEVG